MQIIRFQLNVLSAGREIVQSRRPVTPSRVEPDRKPPQTPRVYQINKTLPTPRTQLLQFDAVLHGEGFIPRIDIYIKCIFRSEIQLSCAVDSSLQANGLIAAFALLK